MIFFLFFNEFFLSAGIRIPSFKMHFKVFTDAFIYKKEDLNDFYLVSDSYGQNPPQKKTRSRHRFEVVCI